MSDFSPRRICTNGTNVPWLESIPQHWGIVASKRLFAERKERALPGDEQLSATQSHGVILQKDYERLVGRKVVRILQHLDKRRHVEKDDFVISMRSFQGGLERAWCRGAIRSSYVVLRPGTNVYVPYFAQLFKSHPYIQALRATSNFIRDGQDLNFSNFCLVDLPVVPMDEQKAIADFLDSNAALVRKFIRNRRRLIEVLNEQKWAIINEAVTRGLDPNVRLKASGVDWLSEVPQAWEELPLKRIARIDNSGSYGDEPTNGEVVLPVATTAQIRNDGRFVVDKMPSRGFTRSDADRYVCRTDDILVVKSSGSIFNVVTGKAGLVDENTPRFAFSNFLLRVVPDTSRVLPRFLYLLLTCRLTRERINRMVAGTTYPNLRVGEYASANLPIPPLVEQNKIVEAISMRTLPLDDAMQHAESEIELMREYRTRLIADVVTGKLDIRHLAPATDVVVPEGLEQLEGEEDFDDVLTNGEDAELEEVANADD